MPRMSISFLLTKRTPRPPLIVAFGAVVRTYTFACITAIAHFRNPQLFFFSFALYTPQEYNPFNSITNFISTHKSYQNLVPAILAEGEERAEINANIAPTPPHPHLANATLLMLARNSDVDSAVNSVREVEDRFNRKYGYPWVFLNEEPFSDDFKRCASSLPLPLPVLLSCATIHADLTDAVALCYSHSRVSNLASRSVHFGQIPEEHWHQPDWINKTLAEEERGKMVAENVIYGGSLP